MKYDDMLDALGYAAKIHLDMQPTPSMNLWRSEYMGEWAERNVRKETAKQILNAVYGTATRDPDLFSAKETIDPSVMREYLNKEKENKTMMNERELMNQMKKGMHVQCRYHDGGCGYIEAFDYAHTLVGIRFCPPPAKLTWCRPSDIIVLGAGASNGRVTRTCIADEFATAPRCPKPKRVIYDEAAGVTVVLWEDGQKTIVRAAEGEQMDVYDAFCAAYCKRIYGSNSALKRELNKILVTKKVKEEPNETH